MQAEAHEIAQIQQFSPPILFSNVGTKGSQLLYVGKKTPNVWVAFGLGYENFRTVLHDELPRPLQIRWKLVVYDQPVG